MSRLGVAAALVGDELLPGDVLVAEGRITEVGVSPAARTGIAVPGFVDLQVNGYAGTDIAAADDAEFEALRVALAQDGVTAFAPTLITGDADDTEAGLRRLDAAPVSTPGGARLLGAHLEGPWISPERLGTHLARFRREPRAADVDRLVAGHRVSLVTLAPERPGAPEAITALVAAGIVVLLGHSAATAAQAAAAFDLGAAGTTHLFNAMQPWRGREPGLAGAGLTRTGVVNGVIADGHHLAAETVRLCFVAAPGRIALVTDATAASGMPDGAYRLGNVDVTLAGGAVRNGDGALAGSAATLAGCVRHCVSIGIGLVPALHAASTVPMRLLGRATDGLRAGAIADVAVLGDDLTVRRVLIDGSEI